MIDINQADAYFATRTVARLWGEFSADQRKAAIEQAKRDLGRALGRAMNEDEEPYEFGDQTRDEYAVYEQAIYTLLRDARPDATGVDIPSLEGDEKKPAAYSMAKGNGKWSEEALAWLGASGRVETVLG